jgi:hypothetical protein
VSNLVGDKNDLVDSNEPVGPIQDLQDQAEDYSDYANWNPEPIDAEPGASPSFFECSSRKFADKMKWDRFQSWQSERYH